MSYLLLMSCSQDVDASFHVEPMALEVRADHIEHISIFDEELLLLKQRFIEPVEYTKINIEWPRSGEFEALIGQDGEEHKYTVNVPSFPQMSVFLEAPIGAEPVPIEHRMSVSTSPKSSLQLMIHLVSRKNGHVVLELGDQRQDLDVFRGRRTSVLYEIEQDVQLTVQFKDEQQSSNIELKKLDSSAVAEQLEIEYEYFPSEAQGYRDLSKSRDQVYIGGWLEHSIREFWRLGRYTDPTLPYAFSNVTIRNKSKQDHNLVVQSRVVDSEGEVEAAFKPQSREGQSLNGWSRVLIRVKSESRASAMVPLYFDLEQLEGSSFQREFEVYILGQNQPVVQFDKELRVKQNSSYILWGTVAGFASAFLGVIFFVGIGNSFPRFSNKQLVSTASFAAMIFASTATAYILSMSLSMALGPFAIMITSIVDALFRITLLITLLSIFPFVGTFSLCVLVGWILSSTVFGGFSPVDALYTFGRIFWTELFLWSTGITRHTDWLGEARLRKSARFAVALVGAGVFHTAAALALQVSLFRLYYADWYVAMILLGPNCIYVAVACSLGVPFSDRVRGLVR